MTYSPKFRVTLCPPDNSKPIALRGVASDPSTFTFVESEGDLITFDSHDEAVAALDHIETMPGETFEIKFVSTLAIAVSIPGPSMSREEWDFTGTYQEAVDRVHALYVATRRSVTLSGSPSSFYHSINEKGEVEEKNTVPGRPSSTVFPAGYPVIAYGGVYAAGIGRAGRAEIEPPQLGNDHPLTRDMEPRRYGVNRPALV